VLLQSTAANVTSALGQHRVHRVLQKMGLEGRTTDTIRKDPQESQQALRWMLHPHDPGKFLKEAWERKAIAVIRNERDYYSDLLTAEDILSIDIIAHAPNVEMPDAMPLVMVNKSFSMTMSVKYASLFQGKHICLLSACKDI